MKRVIFFIFLFVISTKTLFSQDLAIKSITPLRNNLVLFLEDNSIWELFYVKYRSQSWSEWWNSIEVRKDGRFKWTSQDWYINDIITIEDKNDAIFCLDSLSEKNKLLFNQFQYIITNQDSLKDSFARPISLEQLLEELNQFAIEQYTEGYSAGYSAGRSSGKSDGHNEGYSEGYEAGYNDGS